MTKLEQEKALVEFQTKMKNLILRKGNDYSGRDVDTDRLFNFKSCAVICKTKPEINCLHLIAVKVTRLSTLLTADLEPENESIEDSLVDLANYAAIMYQIYQEKKSIKNANTVSNKLT